MDQKMLTREECANLAKIAKPNYIKGGDKFICNFCPNETVLETSLCMIDKRTGNPSWCCNDCKPKFNVTKLKVINNERT